MVWRVIAAIGGLTAAIVVGIAIVTFLSAEPVQIQAAPADNLTTAERAVLPKLDADAKRLVVTLGPNETVRATLQAGTADRAIRVADRARSQGLDPITTDEDRPSVVVTGARSTILALGSMVAVSRVSLEEDTRADRPVPPSMARPVAIPDPGTPYDAGGLPRDAIDLADLGTHRASMLAGLPETIVTIDGQPYERLHLESQCDSEACQLVLVGQGAGSTSYGDRWAFRGVPAGGWIGVLDPGDPPTLTSVPRRLEREAERIARDDAAGAAAIRTMDTIGDPTWDPSTPGLVTLSYQSACGCCGGGGPAPLEGQLADQNPGPAGCVGGLRIVVDVGAGRVVAIRPA